MTEPPAFRTLPPRRAALALFGAALLAACGHSVPEERFAPLDFDYLTKLKLNVANIEIDDSWTPRNGGRQVGAMSPANPLDALRLMGQQRLVPRGTSGRARFVIEDASIVQTAGQYSGNFLVHLDVATSDGSRSGYAEARVSRSTAITDDSAAGRRAALYELTKQMMADMNVEFEYQVRRSLRDYLQSTDGTAPAPEAVQSQDLDAPGSSLEPSAPPLPAEAAPRYAPTLTPGGPAYLSPPPAPLPAYPRPTPLVP